MNMIELFNKAREYGKVYIHTCDKGTYHAKIEFNTTNHIKLEAMSRFDHATVEEALQYAIINAQVIVNEMSENFETLKLIGELNG